MSGVFSPTKPFTIAVVGGGIGGLALAIGLRHRGIDVHVYEAAPVFAEIGAGIAFGPNSVQAMALIEPRIHAAFHNLATKNTEDEDTWITFRKGHEAPDVIAKVQTLNPEKTGLSSVHRARFLDALASLLPDEVAHFGKRLVSLEPRPSGTVRLFFDDGTTVDADAAVGCDGVRSRVRCWVTDKTEPLDDLAFSAKYAYRGLIPMDKAKQALGDHLADTSNMYLGPSGHILTYPIDHGTTMNVVAFHDQPVWEHEQWILRKKGAEMRRDFVGWGKPVQSIMELLEEPDLWALFDSRPVATYCKGQVAILGDAAHASTPHQGAGAGQALEDALILASVLADERVRSPSDIVAAFQAYDAIRRPRSQKVVSTSREAGDMYAYRGPMGGDLEEIRDNLLARCRWIWDEDMFGHVDQALNVLTQKLSDGGVVAAAAANRSKKRGTTGAYRSAVKMFRNWSTRLVRIVQKA
ncbi:MAG: hypothetical protein M1815_000716 [Lichina confinis]|nr:MAG: hypothetical protein M1815_000716 [Lichina confinis]